LSKGASARERTSSPSEADTLQALSSTRHLHHGICVCRSVALLFNLLARPTAPTATACLFRHKGMKERVRWRDVGTMLPRVLVAVRVFTQAKARAWTLTFTFNFLLFFTALCGALVRLNCVAAPTHSCCCPSLLEPSLPWSACSPLASSAFSSLASFRMLVFPMLSPALLVIRKAGTAAVTLLLCSTTSLSSAFEPLLKLWSAGAVGWASTVLKALRRSRSCASSCRRAVAAEAFAIDGADEFNASSAPQHGGLIPSPIDLRALTRMCVSVSVRAFVRPRYQRRVHIVYLELPWRVHPAGLRCELHFLFHHSC